MSKIADAFAAGKAFIPFLTCGDPDLDATGRIVREMARNGADLIELGIPFSDPMAEGPVIQAANRRALSAGATTDRIFDLVAELRQDVPIPLAFMTYANVVFSYGIERFVRRCTDVGVGGLILPDVPYEEREEFAGACRRYGVDLISMIAPTSEHRISMIAKEATGFVYLVSSLGVTGVRSEITTDVASMVHVVREHSKTPCAVGFGISTPQQAGILAKHADGVIVGSAIVRLAERHGRDAALPIGRYVRSMKDAIRGA
jgi:tryptophan synthase alpha chain